MNEELVFNPTRLDISRSVFPVKRIDKGTGFVGHLNAIRPFEVLPGDGWDLSASMLIRFSTPVHPVMDNLFCDVYCFYCSDEMLLKRQSFSPSLNDGNHSFAAIMGAQDGNLNMPYPDAGLTIPVVQYATGGYGDSTVLDAREFVCSMSLMDQLGYPLVQYDSSLEEFEKFSMPYSCLPLLAYISIWNENFREPNLQNRFSLTIFSGLVQLDSDYECCSIVDYNPNYYGDYVKPLDWDANHKLLFAIPFGVCRFHGLYGSLLPFPQRNSDPVFLPLGELAPVITKTTEHVLPVSGVTYPSLMARNGSGANYSGPVLPRVNAGNSLVIASTSSATTDGSAFVPSNLYADLKQATSASINTIRVAFQTQKWFEALARGGNSDLDEYINSLFGVVGRQDVESKRPVYLGGQRFPISISQVNNTASDTGESGAFSLTTNDGHYCRYQSKTYGQIMFVFCIRHEDSFCDVPQKFLTKLSKFDFYFPQFANLGEEGYAKDLVLPSVDGGNRDVFGYQEYAADYRYDVNSFSGQLRFGNDRSWHFASMFDASSYPDLAGWLDASSQMLDVDRTLKVTGKSAFLQFYYDFFVYGNKYRPMPVNSIPGLVDHH